MAVSKKIIIIDKNKFRIFLKSLNPLILVNEVCNPKTLNYWLNNTHSPSSRLLLKMVEKKIINQKDFKNIGLSYTKTGKKTEKNIAIANEINEILRFQKMTQTKLADSLGISKKTVNNWCTGTYAPSKAHLAKIRNMFL